MIGKAEAEPYVPAVPAGASPNVGFVETAAPPVSCPEVVSTDADVERAPRLVRA
jgi:hypothetical protein